MIDEKTNENYYLTFLRHGESIGNANDYHQGQANFPLTDLGKNQISKLARRWQEENKQFTLIISSPLLRAKETALIISEALSVGIQYDPIWMERDNGLLAGLPFEEAKKRYPRPPFIHPFKKIGITGETPWETFLRAGHALQSILFRDPGNYLIVSHGGLLNHVLHAIVGITPQPNEQGARFVFYNSAFATIKYSPKNHKWVILGLNDTAHLSVDSI